MSDARSAMSREQQAQTDFVAAMSQLRPHLAGLEGGQLAFDALTEAILRFGACELRMRRSDRLRALESSKAEARLLAESALVHHKRGLAALLAVRPVTAVLIRQEANEEALSQWRRFSRDVRAEWRDHVSQCDVDGGDAKHLVRIMDECCNALDEGGLSSLGQSLSRQLDELERVRRSDDRGTHAASFPVWKIVAAAGILCLTAYGVWILFMTKAPWWNFWLLAQISCLMMLLISLGC